MGIFSRKNNQIDWDSIKLTDQVYPQNSISLLTLQTETGQLATGWIDKGYKKYEYKSYCPVNILIHVDLTDSIAENNPDLDMGSIEDYFIENMQKIGIAHIVARIVTDKSMDIETYAEKGVETIKYLNEIMIDENRLVSFKIEANEDPKWRAISGLFKI